MKTIPLTETERQYLQNFADRLDMKVNICTSEDKRKKELFCLSINGVSISPKLDYEKLNCFMLGYLACMKETEKNKKVALVG